MAPLVRGSTLSITVPACGPYWGNAYAVTCPPGCLGEEKIVQIECAAYDVAHEKLVWTGRSETFDPVSVQRVIGGFVG